MIRVTTDHYYDNGLHMHVDYDLNRIIVYNKRKDIVNRYDFEEKLSVNDVAAYEKMVEETLTDNINTDDSK